MHIRPSSSTLLALATAVVWSADPAACVAAAGRINGTVTLVTPGGATVQSGGYPPRRVLGSASSPDSVY